MPPAPTPHRPRPRPAGHTDGGAGSGGTVDAAAQTPPTPSPPSPLAGALAQVGDRWSLLVIEALIDGPRRFADLQRSISGIATNVLTQRLRRLATDGLVMAVPYSRRPLRFSYHLTESGQGLGDAVRLLAQWSADHGGGSADTPVHEPCGTALEARWWCPTCEQLGDPGQPGTMWV